MQSESKKDGDMKQLIINTHNFTGKGLIWELVHFAFMLEIILNVFLLFDVF